MCKGNDAQIIVLDENQQPQLQYIFFIILSLFVLFFPIFNTILYVSQHKRLDIGIGIKVYALFPLSRGKLFKCLPIENIKFIYV